MSKHIQTAVKAIRRQITKYENDRDRWESSEQTARENKEWFIKEIERLNTQIKSLEGEQVTSA